MYLSFAILCVAIVPGTFGYEDIHTFMSPEEVRHVFHTDDVHSVPEYEVVKLHMPTRLHKRDVAQEEGYFHTIAFGQNINLWIHPSDSIFAGVDTPVYYAKYSASAPQGVEYRQQPGLMAMVGRIFEDPKKKASLVIGTDNTGRTRVNGFVESNGLAIRSLPQRVADEYSRRRRSVDDFEDPQYAPYHFVIKMNQTFEENHSLSPVNVTRLHERLSRSATEIPDTLYPEILVVAENSVYAAYQTERGHDIYGLLEYLLAFWNGVDLKYRSMVKPTFRFHISAIVLAEDAYATPYIGNHMLSATAFDTNIAMPESKTFYYGVKDTFPLDSYDIAATMTRHSFGIDSGILGQAWLGVACARDDVEKTTSAVTIYKDNGVFSGVHNIAHELGHLFGANHDGITADCQTYHGYIMAGTPWYTINSADFSPCARIDFEMHLTDQKLTCLYNRPHNDGKDLPKLMPGRMKNLDAQCKAHRGGKSCQHKHPEKSVCVNMFCFDSNDACWETGIAAIDGTECGGKNQFCLHQQCVSL